MAELLIEIERRMSAPPDEVFDFLTDASRYTRWMGRAAELDPRPGGIYRVEFSEDAVAIGEYVEVVPPSRIVFTFGWTNNAGVPPGSSRVEISLEPDGDGTLLRLHHSGLPDDATVALHTEGWELYLGQLAEIAGSD